MFQKWKTQIFKKNFLNDILEINEFSLRIFFCYYLLITYASITQVFRID